MARRRGAVSGSKGSKGSKGNTSFMHRGKEGRDRVESEVAKSKQRREAAGKGKVFRFFVPVGETKEFAILDDKPDCFLYEHTLPDPRTGKWSNHVTCPKEHDNCAACEEYGESPYVMFLSVLDFTEYKDSKGEVHEFSRKLMAVKPSQQKKFNRKLEKEGTLRGAVFESTRDNKKDAAIGSDIDLIEYMDEDELANDFIREWTDREGKVHTENMGEPFDYEKIFEAPDADKIRVMLGVEAPLGSQGQQDRDMGKTDDDWGDKDDSDEPWDKDDDGKDSSKKRGKRRGKKGSKKKSDRSSKRDSSDGKADSGKRSRRSKKAKDSDSKGASRSRRTRRSR